MTLAVKLRDGSYFGSILGGSVGNAGALPLYEGQLACATVSHGSDCITTDPETAANGAVPATYRYRIDLLAVDLQGVGSSFYIVDAADHGVHYLQLLPMDTTVSPITGTFGIGSGHSPDMQAILALLHADTGDQSISVHFTVERV